MSWDCRTHDKDRAGPQTEPVQAWEFGRTVRRWRERVTPAAVGVPVGRRRRATGLRREEVAALAGISVDYLTRLEQGRATSPSAQVVEALSRALRLADAEREVLFRLAGHATPGRDLVSSRISASVQRMLDRLERTPLAVYDAMWTLLLANPPYDALMGATTSWRGWERNSVWRNLLGPGNRAVHTPQEQAAFEAGLVGDLRLTASRYPADHRLQRLIDELTQRSPRFEELWTSADVPPHPDQGRRKTIDHPEVGLITLDCDALVVTADDLRILVYTAEPGSDDAERLDLAIVLGTQSAVD